MTMLDLPGKRGVDCCAKGFALAMDVSCHSFLRMTKLAEPLMIDGGCLMTVTFVGAEKVAEHHNMAARAASGTDRFDDLLERTAGRAPTHHLVTVEDAGPCAAFLANDAARQLTGLPLHIDGGYHLVG